MGNEGAHKNLLELGMSQGLQEKIVSLLKRPYGSSLYVDLQVAARQPLCMPCSEC